jgi:hypothetical protein
MKKRGIVMLVLVLATAAQAGMSFVADSIWAHWDYSTTIYLIATGPSSGFAISAVSDGGAGGTASNLWIHPSLTVLSGGFIDNTLASGDATGILFDTVCGYAMSSPVSAGEVLFSFEYLAPFPDPDRWETIIMTIAPLQAGTEFIDLFGDIYTADDSQGDIGGSMCSIEGMTLYSTWIPEPMTVALLGLGGIFLRRRIA